MGRNLSAFAADALVSIFYLFSVCSFSAQKTPEEVREELIYLSPVKELESYPIQNSSVTAKTRTGLLSKVEIRELRIRHRRISDEEAAIAKEFLESAMEVVDAHTFQTPRTYLTSREEEVLQSSLLNAAHVWLSYKKIPHSLYVAREVRVGQPGEWTWSLRILPHRQTVIGRDAMSPQEESKLLKSKVLLFVPLWICKAGNRVVSLVPLELSPLMPISGLAGINFGLIDSRSLTIDRILEPNKHEEVTGKARELMLKQQAQQGQISELSGWVEGSSTPVDTEYLSSYLKEWYGLPRNEAHDDLPFRSPWVSYPLWFLSLDLQGYKLGEWLAKEEVRVEHYDQEQLQRFSDDFKRRSAELVRRSAHFMATVREAKKFSVQKLPMGEPFVWQDHNRFYWVRFTVLSEQIDLKTRKPIQSPLLFVIALMEPERLGHRLQRAVSGSELRDLLITQLNLMEKTILDYKTLGRWLENFAASPENRPDWYGPNLNNIKQRYRALARTYHQPKPPTADDYHELQATTLDGFFQTILKDIEFSSDDRPNCGDLLQPPR